MSSPFAADRQAAFTVFGIAVTAFIGSRALSGGSMTWVSDALAVVSAASLCAFLMLAYLAITKRPNNMLLGITNYVRRKRRERKETHYLLITGTQTRTEGGVSKIYTAGELVPLNKSELEIESRREKQGYDRRIAGPIDVKAWKKLNEDKKKLPK